jgi:hypothetical protein
MSKIIKEEIIHFIKNDNVLIAKIAKELKKSVATVQRNYLYKRGDVLLLNYNVLEIIVQHLNMSKYKTTDDILIRC